MGTSPAASLANTRESGGAWGGAKGRAWPREGGANGGWSLRRGPREEGGTLGAGPREVESWSAGGWSSEGRGLWRKRSFSGAGPLEDGAYGTRPLESGAAGMSHRKVELGRAGPQEGRGVSWILNTCPFHRPGCPPVWMPPRSPHPCPPRACSPSRPPCRSRLRSRLRSPSQSPSSREPSSPAQKLGNPSRLQPSKELRGLLPTPTPGISVPPRPSLTAFLIRPSSVFLK